MASIKVLLKTNKTLSNGEHPIVLRIIKDRKAKFIFTKHSCSKDLWDFKENKPKKKHPNRMELELFIEQKRLEANKILLNHDREETNYTTESFKREFKATSKKITVFTFMDQIIKDLENRGKIGNANVYTDCKRSLKKYRINKDLYFSDIDVSFLKKYEQSFFERGVMPNSVGLHMRTIRSIFNKAMAEKYVKKDLYPFDDYKLSHLLTETTKRALTKEQMDKIINLEIKEWSILKDSKHYFLFSYYNRGMNFTDIAFLKWEDINENKIKYVRTKTGKVYNFSLLEPAINILEFYKPFTARKKGDYVFPILDKDKHKTPKQIANRIKKVTKMVNGKLKTIAEMAELDFHLTTYVARHSYATIMKRKGIATGLISESLGHSTEKTTQIYLDSFENEVLDEANKAIL